jgi:hypothetical protein
MQKDLLQAIDFAGAGQWDAAHELVQQYETGHDGGLDSRRPA